MTTLEQRALKAARTWISGRRAALEEDGRRLLAVIAFGPLVEHASADELDLLEIVDAHGPATTRDITDDLRLDPRTFGRIGLVTMSRTDFDRAIELRSPLALNVLRAFKVLEEAAGVGIRRRLDLAAA